MPTNIIPDCEAPSNLADVANADAKRLTERFYQGVPPPTRRGFETWYQGTGPKVYLRQGFNVFKASYFLAQKELEAQIVSPLQHTKGILDLVFIYRIDAENPWGDWGQHSWRIVEALP